MENSKEILNSLNEKKTLLTDQLNSLDAVENEEDIKTIKTELGLVDKELKAFKDFETYNQELYSRAKRAEGFELVDGKWVKKEKVVDAKPSSNYTLAEIRALGKVHDDDIERVTKWAKITGTTVDVALKDPDLQVLLKNSEEQRKTALATNTGGAARGSSTASGDKILADFQAGKLPSPDDDEGIRKLAEARMAAKVAKKL